MAAKRCPACGTVNRPNATRCDCGHSFRALANPEPSLEDLDEQRAVLAHRLTLGWFACIGGALLVLAVIAVMIAAAAAGGIVIFVGLAMTGIGVTARGALTVSRTRRALRAIERKPLPQARVVE